MDDAVLRDLLAELERTQKHLDEITRKIERTLDELQVTPGDETEAKQPIGSSQKVCVSD